MMSVTLMPVSTASWWTVPPCHPIASIIARVRFMRQVDLRRGQWTQSIRILGLNTDQPIVVGIENWHVAQECQGGVDEVDYRIRSVSPELSEHDALKEARVGDIQFEVLKKPSQDNHYVPVAYILGFASCSIGDQDANVIQFIGSLFAEMSFGVQDNL